MTIPPNVEMRADIIYGSGGGRDLKLNLYLPRERTEPCPAVVFIHGGGWRNGNASQFRSQSLHLASEGYVCACIGYRLSGEAHFPAALEDSKCAVRWLRSQAADLNVDPDRICLSGGSAGGHLAAMVAFTDPGTFEGEGGNPEQSSKASLAVLFNPVADLASMGKAGLGVPMLEGFLGKTYAEAPELYAQGSPISHISKGDPPTLVLHGTKDTTVPFSQAERMVAGLQKAGVPAELFAAEGAAHAFFNRPPWYQPTVDAMQTFLDRHFKAAK